MKRITISREDLEMVKRMKYRQNGIQLVGRL